VQLAASPTNRQHRRKHSLQGDPRSQLIGRGASDDLGEHAISVAVTLRTEESRCM
jgi:hypothetical protein